MAPPSITSQLPPTCTVVVPAPGSAAHDVVPRWSYASISSPPHAIVKPSNEADILQVIKYATRNNLKIIPASGGHGCFVPISDRTIYLDMQNLNSINLNEEAGEVTIGGGSLTGPVLKQLAAKGWYTCTPNSNAVGVVGALLGGLNHNTVGLHGMGVHFIQAITIIPFSTPEGSDPRPLVLNKDSELEEERLFNVLRGAGHGFGIITSVTLKAYRISSLKFTDGKLWTRKLIFPPNSLDAAIDTFKSLSVNQPPQLLGVLAFLRAPPTAPHPGAPMILVSLSYFGPAEDAERACRVAFAEDVTSKAVNAVTAMVDLGTVNDAFEGLNRHGGLKEYHSAFVSQVDKASIQKTFQAWLEFTNGDLKGRGGSYVVLGTSNPSQSSSLAASSSSENFFPACDNGIYVQASPWYTSDGEKKEADLFGKTVVEAIRERDGVEGRRIWGFANNWLQGQDAEEVYTAEHIAKIERAKQVWDENNIGWSPAIDGW